MLHYAFPPGQAMAGAEERGDRALGRFGASPGMPGYHSTVTELQITGANHGDYWATRRRQRPGSRRSPQDVSSDLAIPRPVISAIQERSVTGHSAHSRGHSGSPGLSTSSARRQESGALRWPPASDCTKR